MQKKNECDLMHEESRQKKEYLLLGTNNFWYAVASSLKEAKELKRDILNDTYGQLFGDPESNYCPEIPKDIYIYEVVKN